jgi:predicted RNA-binding protein YlqC (UPF0109 family)
MKELVEFIIKNITGESEFTVEESVNENGFIILTAYIDPEKIGIVIGKGGNTIKIIRSLLRVKATLERKAFTFNVQEKVQ